LRKKLSKTVQSLQEAYEYTKASLRAKMEPPFRVIKRQFGYTKVRYRGLAKNSAQLLTLFTLSNLWMARQHLMGERRARKAPNDPEKGLIRDKSDGKTRFPANFMLSLKIERLRG